MKRANLILMAALAAAGLTTFTGSLLTPAVAVAAENQKIGAKIAKPLRAAQDAIAAKTWDEASAKLVEAGAVEPKTPYEAFMVDELGWFVMLQKKDYQGAVDALSRAVASRNLAR